VRVISASAVVLDEGSDLSLPLGISHAVQVGTHGGDHLRDGQCHDRPSDNCHRQCVHGCTCYRGRLIDSIAIAIAIDPDLQRTSAFDGVLGSENAGVIHAVNVPSDRHRGNCCFS
jgi:hypothetical protein